MKFIFQWEYKPKNVDNRIGTFLISLLFASAFPFHHGITRKISSFSSRILASFLQFFFSEEKKLCLFYRLRDHITQIIHKVAGIICLRDGVHWWTGQTDDNSISRKCLGSVGSYELNYLICLSSSFPHSVITDICLLILWQSRFYVDATIQKAKVQIWDLWKRGHWFLE